ncbi:MAG: hypothetical protein PHP50_10325 [Lachnospiraceae bacterium]|nr:hypothetical protein [Lachnospiraceae bacterium]
MNKTLNVPIQLISVTSTVGELTPVLFKLENEQHEIVTIRIDRIITCKERGYQSSKELIFTCTAPLADGAQHLFNLKYNVLLHKWTLFELLS